MITCISYGDKKYIEAAKLNLETAKMYGADKTILYSPRDIPLEFKLKNWRVYFRRTGKRFIWRGAGYWIWKSYIIKKTLEIISEGDILLYSDAGAVYVNDIGMITKFFDEKELNIMVFSHPHPLSEKKYTKRDVFVIMDADTPQFTDSLQRIGGYIILRKCDETMQFVDEWHSASCDYRLITDMHNVMGKPNYPEFIDHRHDQSLLSIIAKKHGVLEYRDPSQWGNKTFDYDQDVLDRSMYPQIWYSTRNPKITTIEELHKLVPDVYIVPE